MDFKILRYKKVNSTNEVARKLAEAGAHEGTVVVAEEQTAGKGRKGDYWHSPRGGLWFTMILRPAVDTQKSPLLSLLTGLAVQRALKRHGVESRIKLPNDVIANGKKLCGILCETRVQGEIIRYILVGVGINVQNDPPDVGIALNQLLTHNPLTPADLNLSILREFESEYQEFLEKDYYFGEEFQ